MTREAEGQAAPFLRHLSPGCSEQERNAKAVAARDILTAIQAGRDIDLDGVAVIGDLFLDTLPLMSVERLNGLSESLLHDVRDHGIRTVRVIRGALTLTHARVHGMIGTRLHEGLLVVQGPVNLTGTSFEQTLDWSHTAFAGPVDLSDAVLLREAFCLRCLFDQSARFDRTAFGTHSRFHQSRFRNRASFERAGFTGLAEFLEVTFEQETNLSRTYFKQGAGFSGSRFGGEPWICRKPCSRSRPSSPLRSFSGMPTSEAPRFALRRIFPTRTSGSSVIFPRYSSSNRWPPCRRSLPCSLSFSALPGFV
jgi:hypothetical protein